MEALIESPDFETPEDTRQMRESWPGNVTYLEDYRLLLDDPTEEEVDEDAVETQEALPISSEVSSGGMYDHPILTSEQEFTLGEQVQAGIAAEERLATMDYVNEAELIGDCSIGEEGKKAQRQFAENNYRLIVSVINKDFWVDRDKYGRKILEQIGIKGLYRAAQKFDPHRGLKFSTYAVPWIRQAIQRDLQNNGSTIRLAVHDHLKRNKIRRLANEGKTQEEIVATISGLSEERYEEIVAYEAFMTNLVSLDMPLPDENGRFETGELVDTVPAEKSVTMPSDSYESVLAKVRVEKEIETSPLVQALKAHLTEKEMAAIHKIVAGEKLGSSDYHSLKRIRQLVQKPEIGRLFAPYLNNN